MMSIEAESRQKQQHSEPGIVLRLVSVASDRLKKGMMK
jgi:hypothetical protein